jgi:hypothetical protein
MSNNNNNNRNAHANTDTDANANWAVFTEYHHNGYMSHGDFIFTKEQAMIWLYSVIENYHKHRNDRINCSFWIQQDKNKKQYYCTKFTHNLL